MLYFVVFSIGLFIGFWFKDSIREKILELLEDNNRKPHGCWKDDAPLNKPISFKGNLECAGCEGLRQSGSCKIIKKLVAGYKPMVSGSKKLRNTEKALKAEAKRWIREAKKEVKIFDSGFKKK